jgi:hypothetical protein
MRILTVPLLAASFFVGGCPQNPTSEKQQPPVQPVPTTTQTPPREPPKDPLASLSEIPGKLRKDWLQKDAQIILDLASVLPIQESDTPASLLSRFGSDPKRDITKDLGFGGSRHHAYRAGGYISCHLSVLSLKEKIADAKLTCRGSAESWPDVSSVLDKIVKAPLARSEDTKTFVYHYSTKEGEQPLLDAISAELGAAPAVEPPADLKAAFDVLRGEGLTLGSACGAGGSPPKGRRELELLVNAKNIELLRLVLRGISPEGRVYAVEGMQKLAKAGSTLTAEDLSAIEKIKGLDLKLSSCRGCQMTQTTAQEYLGESHHGGDEKKMVGSGRGAAAKADGKLTFTRSCAQSGGTAAVTSALTIDAAALTFQVERSHPTPTTKKGTITSEEKTSIEDIFTSEAFAQWSKEPVSQESADLMFSTHCILSASSSLGEQKVSWLSGAPNTPESENTKDTLLQIFSAIEARATE